MNYRYLLRLFFMLIFSFCSLFVGFAQERETSTLSEYERIRKEAREALEKGDIGEYIILAGINDILDCLEPAYCQNSGSVLLYPNDDWTILGSTVGFEWEISVGGVIINTPENLITKIGEGLDAEFYFNPELLADVYLSRTLKFEVFQVTSTGFRSTSMSDETTVLPIPTIFNLTGEEETCSGSPITLDLSGSQTAVRYRLFRDDVYTFTLIDGTGDPISFPNISTSGLYTVRAEIVASGCQAVMNGEIDLEVYPLPTPIASSDEPTYCEGDQIKLSAEPDGMVLYEWTFPDGATTLTDQNPIISNASRADHHGQFSLFVRDANGCENTTTINITVNENPEVSIIAPEEACEDSDFTIQAIVDGGTGPFSYYWEKDGDDMGLPSTTSTISINGADVVNDSGIYTVVVTDNNGCGSDEASTNITINPRPQISAIDYTGDVCEGGSITLSIDEPTNGDGNYTYHWELGGMPIPNNSRTLTINPVSLTDAGTYTVIVEDGNGCFSDVESQIVVVFDNPEAELLGLDELCVGSTGTYTGSGGDEYEFFIDGSLVQAKSTIDFIEYTPVVGDVGIRVIRVVVHTNDGCTDTTDISVEVYPLPVVSISLEDPEICAGSNTNLIIQLTTGTAPWTVTYSDGTDSFTESNIPGNTFSISVSPTENTTYSIISVEDTNGCELFPVGLEIELIVNENPTVFIDSDNTPSHQVCLDGTIVLTATPDPAVGNYVYQWFHGADVLSETGSTLTLSNVTLDDAGTYSVIVTNIDTGCFSDSDELDVEVTQAIATLSGAASFCETTTETYIAGGGVSYRFLLDGSEVQGWSADFEYTTDPALTDGDYTLRVEIVDVNGCEDFEELEFTVNPQPTAIISLEDAAICETGSTNLIIELSVGTAPWTVTYSDGTDSFTENSIPGNSISIPVSPAVNTTYSIISVEDANGCELFPVGLEVELVVNENPTVDVDSDNSPDHQVCVGNDLELFASPSGGSGNYVYRWYRDGVVIPGEGNISYTITNAQIADAVEYSVVAIDSDTGCESTPASLTVVVTEASATLDGELSFCETLTETYTAGGGVSYRFLIDGTEVQGWSADNEYTTDASLTSGTYILRVEIVDANGCEDFEELEFTVNPQPTVIISLEDPAICETGSTNLIIELSVGTAPWSVTYSDGTDSFTENNISGNSISIPVSPVVNTIYSIVSVEDANGCELFPVGLEIELIVNENPTVDIDSDNSPSHQVCLGQDLELEATPSGGSGNYVYRWYRAGAVIPGEENSTYTIINAQFVDAVEYSVVAIDSDTGCESDPASLTVEVTQATATLDGALVFCENTSETYTAGGGVSYRFLIDGAEVQGWSADNEYNTDPALSADDYTLRVEIVDANGCEAFEEINFSVNAAPEVTPMAAFSVCEDGDFTLQVTVTGGAGPYNFQWDGPDNFESDEEEPQLTNVTLSASGTYTVVVTDANGCGSASADIDVTVNERPVISSLDSDSPHATLHQVCRGNNLTLTTEATGGTGVYTYTWIFGGNTIQTGPDNTLVINNADENNDAGVYTVIVNDGNCDSESMDIEVVVTFATAVLNVTDDAVCEGIPVTFSAGGGVSYEFFVNGTSVKGPGALNTYTTSDLSDGDVVMVEVIDVNGCVDSEMITITIHPLPVVSISENTNNVCSGEPIIIEATSGYVNYDFRINGTSIQNSESNIFEYSNFVDGDLVSVRTSSEFCSTLTGPLTIEIRDLPEITLESDQTNDIACDGEDVIFTAGGGIDYQFYLDGDLVQDFGNGNTWTTNSLVDGQVVRVVGEGANGCFNEETVTMEVNTPVATMAVSPNRPEHCANETVRFTASAGELFEFFLNGNSQGETTNPVFEHFPPLDGDEIYVVITNEFGCVAASDVRELIVNPVPIVNLNVDVTDETICEGEEVIFTATADPEWNYRFFILRDGADIQVQDGLLNTYSTTDLQDGDEVYVVVRDENSCNGISPSVIMTVNPNPEVTLNVLPSNHISEGQDVTLEAIGNGVEFLFYINDVEVPEGWISDNTYDFNNPEDGDLVYVDARSALGCITRSDTIEIMVDALPFIFNILPIDPFYCADATGVQLYLEDYEEGVRYDLYDVTDLDSPYATGVVESGVLVWNDVPAGTYRVRATRLLGVEPNIWFPDDVIVSMEPTPTIFDVEPAGTVETCPVSIELIGSEEDFIYMLYRDGVQLIGSEVTGTGGDLLFGEFDMVGVYTILATNPATGCTAWMNGEVDLDLPPVGNLYDLLMDPENGQFCEGGMGVNLYLSESTVGVNYQLYREGLLQNEILSEDGGEIHFGLYTIPGVYQVFIEVGSGCRYPMSEAVIVMNSLPEPRGIEADNNGHFCEGSDGVEIRLIGSQANVRYELHFNTILVAELDALPADDSDVRAFEGLFDQPGIYTVYGITEAGCIGIVATIELTRNELPEIFTIEGNDFCADPGIAQILLTQSQTGISYELWHNGLPTGEIFIGNGGQHIFEYADEGEFSVLATNIATGCEVMMDGILELASKPMPELDVQVVVDNDGADCENGALITILNSEVGVVYELWYQIGSDQGPTGNIVIGDGSNVDFPERVVDVNATYLILAELDGCSDFLISPAYVNVPGAIQRFLVLGDGTICEGDAGVQIELSSSQLGVTYTLWSLGGGVGGSNKVVSFIDDFTAGERIDFGLISDEGDYIIVGSNADCDSIPMHGMVELRFNSLPIAYQLTGSGIYCDDNVGAVIGLDGSEENVIYTLIFDDAGIRRNRDTITGSGSEIFFESQIEEGYYTVYARNSITGCTSSMNGEVEVIIRDTPDVSDLIISGHDNEFDCGYAEIHLSGVESGVHYSLYHDGELVQNRYVDVQNSIIFGSITESGVYSIYASYNGACEVLVDEFTLTIEESLSIGELTKSEDGCVSSVTLTLSESEVGVNYQLVIDEDDAVGEIMPGTGAPLVWIIENQGTELYRVIAEIPGNLCPASSNQVLVNIISGGVSNVFLDTEYCSDGDGVTVRIDNTVTGVYYDIVADGDYYTRRGNGGSIFFEGIIGSSDGIYYEIETSDACVTVDQPSFTVTALPSPEIFRLTRTTDSQEFVLSGSEQGVWYFLLRNGRFIFDDINYIRPGTGSPVNFGYIDIPGYYTVVAQHETSDCEAFMDNIIHIDSELPDFRANDDVFYLGIDRFSGIIDVARNDRFDPFLDEGHLEFMLIDPMLEAEVERFTLYLDNDVANVPIAELSIDTETGEVSYSKLQVSYFGIDSVQYSVRNTQPGLQNRYDTANITIVVGNKDIDERLSFILPNAFSPNGDGLNDFFIIQGLDNTYESNLEVFNRWGTVVYRSRGRWYNNDWDGTANSGDMVSIGKELPVGVYFYVFSVKVYIDEELINRTFSGFIELRR
ncbi:T9SS type B sorting domain-containing protein [Natronoflexus pectinivorans]|uniref:Gliding motility-associated-like protein n=1 Tax=Natronoflexus pectinivorans TaxID=682526 RepID=A0A4R2GNR8_9BACT|nr:gliding motility-associated C-terminal domain-containing protein [Natronoflexus pectinivorans]TCO09345.1 gliding motility-associated-like protein [Natronoflexus pectinivorans]